MSYADHGGVLGCLYALWHSVDAVAPDASVTVRFDELQAVLPPIYSLCWSLIAERMRTGKVSALKLGKKEAAALLFLQVHGYVPSDDSFVLPSLTR